ncbi:hypothetical protein SGRIM128S_09646 [Streptomyces griseomycini]
MNRVVHPIEQESFRRLRARLDTSHFPPLTRAVVERVVHSSADLDYASDLVMDEGELARAHTALHAGATRSAGCCCGRRTASGWIRRRCPRTRTWW